MRRIVSEIKVEDVMPTIEANMTLIKGADTTNKAGMAHVMEVIVLQTVAGVMVDNTVLTKKCSSLEVTSVITSAPI
jgi:hypothetical protein